MKSDAAEPTDYLFSADASPKAIGAPPRPARSGLSIDISKLGGAYAAPYSNSHANAGHPRTASGSGMLDDSPSLRPDRERSMPNSASNVVMGCSNSESLTMSLKPA